MNIQLPCTQYDWGDEGLNMLSHQPQHPSNMSSLVALMDQALSQQQVLHLKISEINVKNSNHSLEQREICTLHYGDFGFALNHINPQFCLPFSWREARIIDDDCFFTGLLELESNFSHTFIHDISFEARSHTSTFKRLDPSTSYGNDFESWPSRTGDEYEEIITTGESGGIYPSKVENGVRYIGLRSWGQKIRHYWQPVEETELAYINLDIQDKANYSYWEGEVTEQIFEFQAEGNLKLPQIPNYTRNLSESQMRTQLLDVLWYAECTNFFFPRYPKNQLKKFIDSLILDGKKWVFPAWTELPSMATSSLVYLYCIDGASLIKIISGFPHQQAYRIVSMAVMDDPSAEDFGRDT